MHRARVVALMALSTITLAGCGEVRGAEEKKDGSAGGGQEKMGPVRLAVVPKAVGFDFWEQVKKGAECAASKEKDVDVTWDGVTTESDVTGQINLLQNFITEGVDGIVFAATDAKALGEVTKAAQQKQIPVVNMDSGTDPQPPEVPLFATDNVAGAEKVADLMAEEVKQGKVALVSFNPGSQTNNERTEGFKTGLKSHPKLELVAEQNSESDYNKALSITEDILSANPDLKGIFGSNESSALGAAAAVRRAGKAGDVTIIGWDAAPDELKALKEGTISALIVQNPFNMGFQGVKAAVSTIRDGAQPKGKDTGSTVVTKKNLNSTDVKAVLAPSCANPPTG